MPKLGNALDFAQLEALNIRIHQAGSAPTSPAPVKGQMYFNNVGNELYYFDGSGWQSAKSGVGSSGPPNGPAGGNLAGTYPNPTIGLLQIDDTHVKAANKDGASGTPSLRTLGTGAAQAASGADARLSDSRTPGGSATGDLGGSYPAPTVLKGQAGFTIGGTAAVLTSDGRLSDARAPTAHKSNHEPGGSDAMTVNAAVGVGSLRTLALTALAAMPGDTPLHAIAVPTAARTMNNQQITGLADPTNPQDAATKAYVDAFAVGLDPKASVKAATTANIASLAGGAPNTLDGQTLAANDRILVKDQSTGSQNGIYVVTTLGTGANGTWTRSTDADVTAEVNPGMFVFVEQGTVNADSGWVLSTDAPITLGTTALTFVQFSGAGQVVAGTGLTKTGNTLDVIGTANRITAAADAIDIASNYVGQATITTLGTITAGIWQGTDIAVADGGTGASAAPAARTNLGAAGYYSSATHGAGATISITQVTHQCRASRGLIVQVQEEATGLIVMPDVTVAASGDVTVTFGASVAANAYRVTVIG